MHRGGQSVIRAVVCDAGQQSRTRSRAEPTWCRKHNAEDDEADVNKRRAAARLWTDKHGREKWTDEQSWRQKVQTFRTCSARRGEAARSRRTCGRCGLNLINRVKQAHERKLKTRDGSERQEKVLKASAQRWHLKLQHPASVGQVTMATVLRDATCAIGLCVSLIAEKAASAETEMLRLNVEILND